MKDLFVVQFAAELILQKLKVAMPGASWLFEILGPIWNFFATRWLGYAIEMGVLVIDLTNDSIDIALEQEAWKDAAAKAYKKATAKVYTEEEKRAIRQQYLDALRKWARVGNGPK